jgi:hypothetical protein
MMIASDSLIRERVIDGESPATLRRTAILVVALVLVAASASASAGGEIQDPLVGDRPDFTDSTETIAPRRVQLEAGATAESGDVDVLTIGESLIRFGLVRRWELRVGANSWVSVDSPSGDDSGFDDPSLAAKVRFNPDDEGLAVGLLFGSTLAVGDEDIGAPDEQPFVKLLLGGELSQRLSWGANAGYARASESGGRFDQLSGSFSLGIGIFERLGAFAEIYGFSEESEGGDTSTYADTGLTYLLSDDLRVDARVGSGIDGNDVDFFFGAGVVKRW